MSDVPPNGTSTADDGFNSENPQAQQTEESGIGFERVLYMLLFGFLAWVTLWVLFVVGIVQLIVALVDKKPNEDLTKFARNGAQYMYELLAYLVFASDETPFPFGKFPDTSVAE